MEETPGLCIDPEEDEIFFYGITGKGVELKIASEDKSVQQGTDIFPGHPSYENKQISEDGGLNIESGDSANDVKTVGKLGHVPYPELPVNGSDMTAEGSVNICENIEKPKVMNDEANKQEEHVSIEKEEVEVNSNDTPVVEDKKKEMKNELNQTNILEDHNYSTPVKTVIDKSILKTPKSVVKADKDGGFLKVLSEIALVKAEVDENTNIDASVYSKKSLVEHINNVDNKENENCFQPNIMDAMKSNEEIHMKSLENAAVKKLNETQELSEVTEMTKDNFICATDCEKVKETTIEDEIMESGDVKSSNICEGNNTADETDEVCEMECAPSCKESLDDSDDLEVIYENLTADVKKLAKEEKTEKLVDVSNLIQLDSFVEKSSREDADSDEVPCNNHVDVDEDRKESIQIRDIPEINLIDATLPTEKFEEKDNTSLKNVIPVEDERHKKFLRRRTMNLLHELSEIVNQKQAERDERHAGLSEEAAKVIQKLKAVGIDDSITSPNQYFDLDNLNESFFSSEVSDILNDTLSIPMNLLTTKDVELLLEKINYTCLEDELQPQNEIAEVLDAEKENLCQNKKAQESLKKNIERTEKICEKTPHNKFGSSKKSEKTPASVKTTLEHDKQKKFTPAQKFLFKSKSAIQKPLAQSQANQNTIRVGSCQTAEKVVKANIDAKIPKQVSSTSKIPTKGSAQIQSRIPTFHKTPYNTAAKSLKYNNIKSPVQAYISMKAPVLVSNIKGKPETGLSVWTEEVTSDTTTAKPQVENKVAKNIQKPKFPVISYKSAIPLKLEKSPESRLPRLAPKMQKLILGNSPVVAKHEGRIKLATTRPQINTNESSIIQNRNEFSVIMRKVALNTDIKK